MQTRRTMLGYGASALLGGGLLAGCTGQEPLTLRGNPEYLLTVMNGSPEHVTVTVHIEATSGTVLYDRTMRIRAGYVRVQTEPLGAEPDATVVAVEHPTGTVEREYDIDPPEGIRDCSEEWETVIDVNDRFVPRLSYSCA